MTQIPQVILDEITRLTETTTARPRRGEEIFEGTDYPRSFAGFIGQEEAVEQLTVAIGSAKARDVRLGHTLIASGIPGVGKSTLAALTAYVMGVGLVSTTGPLTAQEFRSMAKTMEDRDIMHVDEAHLLTMGGKNKADWLLPWMLEGKLYTERGAEVLPDITLLCTTTDPGKLLGTLLTRFSLTPQLTPYNSEQGTLICAQNAARMGVAAPEDSYPPIARAAANNPRIMRKILDRVRDLNFAYPESHPNLEKAFRWAGVSEDGLSTVARDILILLYVAEDHTEALATLASRLNEPGPIDLHEQQLLQRGLITITGRGRKLTDAGVEYARKEALRTIG
jgi:Holliday junction resolvasome RuvABC ATP-dependent DNA helicase subunit